MRYSIYEEEFGSMPSRYMCNVLDDMRKMDATKNFSGLLGSIEQLQVMAYRMEAALGDKRTLEEYESEAADYGRDLKVKRNESKRLEKELERLRKEKKDLVKKIKRYRHIYNKETKVCCERFADNMSCDCPK